MRMATKILLIIAASLVALGLICVAVGFAALRFDFKGIFGANYEAVTHEVSEDFDSISINTDTADVIILKSEDDICKVVCNEQKNLNHSVRVESGVLCVEIVDTRAWYDHISLFSIGEESITVYLPKTEYNALSIEESTGDINIAKDFSFKSIETELSTGDVQCYASAQEFIRINASTGDVLLSAVDAGEIEISTSTGDIDVVSVECAGDIKISVSTGDVELSDVNCKNLTSNGDTGEISMNGVVATENLSVERSTGDVEFNRCDAAEIVIVTDTGDVNGSLLSEKVFIVSSDTGRVNVPEGLSGGKCKITTDTGDISISLVD